MVQADLADGQQLRVVATTSQGIVEPIQVAIVGTVDKQGVDAERIAPADSVRQQAHPVKPSHVDGRNHAEPNASDVGALNHRVAIGIELGSVEVAMGVDPHAAMMPRPWRGSCM